MRPLRLPLPALWGQHRGLYLVLHLPGRPLPLRPSPPPQASRAGPEDLPGSAWEGWLVVGAAPAHDSGGVPPHQPSYSHLSGQPHVLSGAVAGTPGFCGW